ncbi:MAG: hypothetical protein K2M95_04855 [Clostridiales bacterium]|nr:hypothetical protein [Clostridiales bacterium]
MKKQFKYLFVILTVCLAAACFVACSKGEYNSKGAGEIVLTLSADYDGVHVDCPEGEVTGADKNYTVKVKTRNRTDVIVSCKGYHTVVVPVYTKDFVGGVARKSVTLEKRYNTVTLTVSGVADMSGVEVRAENANTIRETTVRGKKVTVTLNDFASADEIDTLSVVCDGYYTYAFDVKATDFVDYSASVKVSLLSTASSDASLTLINDTSGDSYYINVVQFDDFNAQGESCNVSKSTTLILDKTKNYVVRYSRDTDGYGYYPIASKDFAATPYKTVRLSELKDLSAGNYYNYDVRVRAVLSPTLRDKLNPYGHDVSDNWLYSYIAIIKDGKTYHIGDYEDDAYVMGVKKGDTVRVVAASNTKFVADYTVTLGDMLTIEDRIENESKITFRFFDTHGNRVDADENLVQLHNGYGSEKHFVDDDVEYVNATDIGDIASVSEDNKEIVLDWSKLMAHRSLYNDELYVENITYLYLVLENKYIYLQENLYARDHYDITVRESFDLFLTLNDLSGNPLTDLELSGWDIDTPIEYHCGGYTVRFTDGAELELNVIAAETNDEFVRYERIQLLAYKEFFAYDASNGRYTLTYGVSRKKVVQIVNTGDAVPPDAGGSVYIGNDWFYLDSDGSDWNLEISEKSIGKTMQIRFYYDEGEYTASVKITREMFDSGVITVKITHTSYNR